MSIHKLKLGESRDPFDLMKSIIIEHNKKKENAKRPYKYLSSNKVRGIKQEKINEEKEFEIKIFIQLVRFVSTFSHCYIDEDEIATQSQPMENIEIEQIDEMPYETATNAIIFYYRPGCVFAVTKRNSWRVVQRYADFEFPLKIAEMLLNQNGSNCLLLKHVLGENVTSQSLKYNPTPIPSDPLDPVICTKFIASLEKNSTLLQLDLFKNNATSQSDINVAVGLGYIRIAKEFAPHEWIQILDHLDFICKKNEAVQKATNKKSKAFRQCLQSVDTETSKLLNTEL